MTQNVKKYKYLSFSLLLRSNDGTSVVINAVPGPIFTEMNDYYIGSTKNAVLLCISEVLQPADQDCLSLVLETSLNLIEMFWLSRTVELCDSGRFAQ